MPDDFREFVELPGLPPTKAEDENGHEDVPDQVGGFDLVDHLPPIPAVGETPRERSIIDRKGREWTVTAVEDAAGEKTVTLRFRHGAIEVLAQAADPAWARLPSSKLLAFAGLD